MKYLLIGLTVAGIVLGLAYLLRRNPPRSYQHNAAVDGFIQVTELAPDDAGAYNNKGIDLFAPDDSGKLPLERIEEAIAAFDKAISRNQGDAVIYQNKGLALWFAARYSPRHHEAIAAFDKSLELKPDSAAAYNMKGILLFETERFEEAIDAYDKAIAADPTKVSPYINKANTLDYLGKHEDALALYDSVIAMASDDPVALQSAYGEKGIALSQLGRHEEAQVAFDEVDTLAHQLQTEAQRKATDSP